MGRGIMKWSKWSGEQNMGLPQVRGRWKESAHWSYLISPTWLSTIIRWSCSTTVVTFRKGWRSSKRGLAWPWCTSIHYQAVYGGMKRWCSWWRTAALSIPAWGWSRRAIDVGVDELLANPPEFGAGLVQNAIDSHVKKAITGRSEKWEASANLFQYKDAGNNYAAVGSSPRFRVYGVDLGHRRG